MTYPTEGASAPFGIPVVLQATASDADGFVTKVDFLSADKVVGSVAGIPGFPNIPFVYVWTPPTAGFYRISARAVDNLGATTTSAAASFTLNSGGILKLPPTVSLKSPTNGASFREGTTVLIEAEAIDDGKVMSVEFFDTDESIGLLQAAPYALSLTNLDLGEHVLMARAKDDEGNSSDSAKMTITINSAPPNLLPKVQLAGVRDLDTLPLLTALSLTATAQDTDGTVVAVEYFDGERSLGKSVSPPFPLAVAKLSFGIHTITARATDNTGAVGASAPATIRLGSEPSTQSRPTLFAAVDPSKTHLNLTAGSEPGHFYAVEASPDLQHWYPIDQFPLDSGAHTVEHDLGPANEFFRIQQTGAEELPNPLRVFVDTSATNSVAAEAGDGAFTLSLTNSVGTVFTLDIPTNALFSPTLIKMTEVRELSGSPFAGVAAVTFSPAGLLLLEPATLTVKLATDPGTNRLAAFAWRADGTDLHLVRSFANGRTLTTKLFRLAGCGAATLSPADVRAQSLRRPADLLDAAEQASAVLWLNSPLISALKTESLDCTLSGASRMYKSEFYTKLYPGLNVTCDELVSRWFEFTVFRNRLAFSGCTSSLAEELEIIDAYLNSIGQANRIKDCLVCGEAGKKFGPESVAKLLRLYRFAQRILPADLVEKELTPLLHQCLSFDLEIDSINSGTGGNSASFNAHVSTPASPLHLEFYRGVVIGTGALDYSSFTWPTMTKDCVLEGKHLVSGQCTAFLDFGLNFLDQGASADIAMELKIAIGPTPRERAEQKCYDSKGNLILDLAFFDAFWNTAFAVAHMDDDKYPGGGAYDYIFGTWEFPLGSPWAVWKGPRSKRHNHVLYKDDTTFKLYHTPGKGS